MKFHAHALPHAIITPLGETDEATIMNGIGQGSFAAALASSLNIGCGVEKITRGICSANIGELELNSLIFQDDIAKMNRTMEDARKGAKEVGRILESKQLRANMSTSKFVLLGPPISRTELLKEAEANPIKMAETIIEPRNTCGTKYMKMELQPAFMRHLIISYSGKREDKIVLWRKITRALKAL